MPKIVFKSTALDIKRALLDRIIDAYLERSNTTRTHVAQRCGVSKTTAGKVASALTSCGFMTERLYADKGERPSIHLLPTENLNIMLLDLSTPRYTMSIVSTGGKCHFENGYDYNADVSYEDNLNVFLSRCGYLARKAARSYAAICVIYYDSPTRFDTPSFDNQAHLPILTDKDKTDEAIFSIFHRYPDIYIGASEAIEAAAQYGLFPATEQGYGISYIFAGSYLYAFNVSNSTIKFCNLRSLMIKGTTAGNMIQSKLTRDELELLLTRAVNFMDCAFGAGSVVIESDLYQLDEGHANAIAREFAKVGEFSPNLLLSTLHPSIKLLGAVKHTFALIVKRCLIASDDKSQ